MNERKGFVINGYVMFLVLLASQLFSLFWLISDSGDQPLAPITLAIIVGVCWAGFFMNQPNQAKAMTFFGSYVGTAKNPGLSWTIPFFIRKNISLRVRNFESGQLKVNDNHGNPIEIASVVVWMVEDTAEALFEVDDYESYVNIQSEAALRNMATTFPYDLHEGDKIALRSHPKEVSEALQSEIQQRLAKAGVRVIEARISHLAYAPEIASAMLQRQQASAIIAARSKIVDGAVGMVESALTKLSENQIVELDEERKAAMVSNLLVVLCGDHSAKPVINAGTIY